MKRVRNNGTAHVSMRQGCMTSASRAPAPREYFTFVRLVLRSAASRVRLPRCDRGNRDRGSARPRRAGSRRGIHAWIHRGRSAGACAMTRGRWDRRHDRAAGGRTRRHAAGRSDSFARRRSRTAVCGRRSRRRRSRLCAFTSAPCSISQRAISISSKSTHMCSSVVPASGVPCKAREWSAWHPNSGG